MYRGLPVRVGACVSALMSGGAPKINEYRRSGNRTGELRKLLLGRRGG